VRARGLAYARGAGYGRAGGGPRPSPRLAALTPRRRAVRALLVAQTPLRQWVLKITEYAERLAADVNGLDWPEGTKNMQARPTPQPPPQPVA
jgi:hypothetical protein